MRNLLLIQVGGMIISLIKKAELTDDETKTLLKELLKTFEQTREQKHNYAGDVN